ncbi:MAG: glycosyltransferase family 25 protein [Gammaproteobacteria bacterium]|nr:glycosyltransferase family 25 protein [Gammaproteobacteria bacterium]
MVESLEVRIITLDPRSTRCRNLVARLSSQSIPVELFEGVDGRSGMPVFVGREALDQSRARAAQQVELTSSEIGCYLSHLRVITAAFERGVDKLCVLEDDVDLEPSCCAVLRELAKQPDGMEFVRLMGLKIHKRKTLGRLVEGHMLTRPVKGLCGAQGYVINRPGMQKVIEYGVAISEPIDKFFDHFWEIDLRCYAVEPHVIWECPGISSIRKLSRDEAAATFGAWIRKHVMKLQRSLKRRAYIRKRRSEFSPAQKPVGKPGRTARIR